MNGKLNTKQQEIASKVNEKVAEWLARGTEVKKIQNAIWNNWGVLSEVKNGELKMAMFSHYASKRGGLETGSQVVIGTYKI